MTDRRDVRLRGSMLLALLVVSLTAMPAWATHFRYGHITWAPRADIDPNAVDFTVQSVWRRDAYSTANGRCIDAATLGSIGCTGTGDFAGVGDLIREQQGNPQLDPGDGSALIGGPAALAGALLYQVTAVDEANNWAFGLAVDPVDLAGGVVDTDITHIYPGPGDYTAMIDDCCRISPCVSPTGHMNNPDGSYRVETIVNITTPAAGNSSPVSALPPIIQCPINGLCEFTVPASDNELDPLTFRLSTPAESGLTVQPGAPQCPNAATIDPSTGEYSWDTTGCALSGDPLGPPPNGGCNNAGFNTCYSTQVMVEETATGGSRSALDFFVCLVQCPPSNTPPVFDMPPTPVCGQTVSVAPGGTAMFTVQASDAETAIDLNATGVPGTATLTPGLPSSGNPVSSTFAWTPTVGDLGQHVVTFTATDQCAPTLCDVTIDVSFENCSDGVDNDGDLLADCADPDCDGVVCDDGAFCTINDSCQAGACGGEPNPCNDGNGCTADSCVGSACVNDDQPGGTACNDDGDLCTVDACDGAGGCVQQSVVTCAGPTQCDGGQSCNPGTGLCQDLPDVAASTPCTDADGNACTTAGCDGAGSCDQSHVLLPAGTPCGDPSDTECTDPDTCDGSGGCQNNDETSGTACGVAGTECTFQDTCLAGGCQDNGFAPSGASCGDASDTACDNADSCDGGGSCLGNNEPDGTACGDAGTECTNQDTCAGGSCQDHGVQPAGAACSDADGSVCTTAGCDGAGGCNQTHVVLPAGTACPDTDGTACTAAACDGGGACNQSHGVVTCAGSAECDGGQSCNPANGLCEDTPDAPDGTACADTDGNDCTMAQCDGAGACNQSNAVQPEGTSCESDGDLCTIDACDGGGTCTVGATVVCRVPDAFCDGGEVCNPATGLCDPQPDPPAGTPCDDNRRCTIDETCDGAGKCQLGALSSECLGGFKCYKSVQINPPFDKFSVDLVDTFVSTTPQVKRPRRVCNPAAIEDEGFVGDPAAHMMCYKIREPRFTRTDIIVEDRFGQQSLTVNTTRTICLPAEMAVCDGVGGSCDPPTASALEIDHLKCYTVFKTKACLGGFNDGIPCIDPSECDSGECKVKRFETQEVTVGDLFEDKLTAVKKPKMLCTPAQKNAEPVIDLDVNYLCYKIKDVPRQPKFRREFFQTVDQFGQIDPLRAVRGSGLKASLLCVKAFIRPAVGSPSGAFLEMSRGALE